MLVCQYGWWFIKRRSDSIHAPKPAAGGEEKVTGFVFYQVGYIIKRKRKWTIPAGKEIFKRSPIESGEPFAGANPYKATAILCDAVDAVIAEAVGRAIVLKKYFRRLRSCSVKNNKACNKNTDIPGNSISFIHVSKIEKRNHLQRGYGSARCRVVKNNYILLFNKGNIYPLDFALIILLCGWQFRIYSHLIPAYFPFIILN